MYASGRHLERQVSTVIVAITCAAIAGCMNSGDKSATGTTTTRRSVAPVAQSACQPEAIARKAQDLVALINQRRFAEVSAQWGDDPLPGLGVVFAVARRSGNRVVGVTRARSRDDLPAALRRWVGLGGKTIMLKDFFFTGGPPREIAFQVTWTRGSTAKERVPGAAKNVWDCRASVMRVLNGEESAQPMPMRRFLGGRPCSASSPVLTRHGMTTRVCGQ